ncbi:MULTISPECIES: hypothetical protein [Nitrosopumilus]|uniref:Uncharacterized protein n=1 Tax=Nitrosopumilus piranensis TaxID=1582439 RepID=A0A0C5CB77_9ARCH|nr:MULTISPECIES: hypothetical protein [Nitrosopumilus]AJM92442.1 hypothetical protein NPIRD3C_1230 [Nitrosopumilus piranensis]KAF6244349.1 hypothetical protein C6989_08700 [Nitrosopumilus sp. b2]
MTILTQETIDEILTYLEKSINNLAKDVFGNLELDGGFDEAINFLKSQFDIRLENLLVAKGSSTHHLESGMKNKIIQRKQEVFQNISKQYQN